MPRLWPVLLMAAAVPAYAGDAGALRARYAALQPELADSEFGRPLLVKSRDEGGTHTGVIYAAINLYALCRQRLDECTVGIQFQHEGKGWRKIMHMESCPVAELFRGDGGDNPLAGAAGKPLEHRILENIGRQTRLGRNAADTENAEIGPHQFELPKRHGVDRRT